MFGRIRASTSSLDTLEGSPSKILKDDSFSIYEATLMKLKLGAQRNTIPCASSKEIEINDCSVTSPTTDETNLKADINSATASCSAITFMDTQSDCASTGNSEQPRQSNVSILHFFKFKDSGVSLSVEPTTSTRNGSSESHYTCEVEGIQTLQHCEMLE